MELYDSMSKRLADTWFWISVLARVKLRIGVGVSF